MEGIKMSKEKEGLHLNHVQSHEPGKGFLVLNRPEGYWTTIRLTPNKDKIKELINILDDILDGSYEEEPVIGLAFRVYNITHEDSELLNFLCKKLRVSKESLKEEFQTNSNSSVNVAFDDPNRYFQIDRPERFHRSHRKEED
jgi:hypothetical protein